MTIDWADLEAEAKRALLRERSDAGWALAAARLQVITKTQLKNEALEAAVLELSGRITGAVKELDNLSYEDDCGHDVVDVADVCSLLRSPNQP